MTLTQEVDVLRNIPLFARIAPSKLKLLAFASERIEFQPQQLVMRQGDSGDSAYIILEGDAEVLVDTPNGQLKVAELGRNDIIGEIAILIDVPRTATVRATAPLATLRISKDLFFRMITEFPQMSIEIMRELAHRLEKTTGDLRQARSAQQE